MKSVFKFNNNNKNNFIFVYIIYNLVDNNFYYVSKTFDYIT